MRKIAALGITCLFLLAGCSSDDSDSTGTPTETPGEQPAGSGNATGGSASPGAGGAVSGNATTINATAGRMVNLTASVTEGEAPLLVTFTVTANGTNENTTFWLGFGDGSDPVTGTGAEVPAEITHEYTTGGVFTAMAEFTWADGATMNSTVQLTISADVREPPSQTSFEFGPGLGCAAAGDECISLVAGPTYPAVDGFFVPLDERYIGYTFTSTVDNARADSDGWFLDADLAIKEAVHGSDKGATGVVKEGYAWLFIFSFAEPHLGITVDFELI